MLDFLLHCQRCLLESTRSWLLISLFSGYLKVSKQGFSLNLKAVVSSIGVNRMVMGDGLSIQTVAPVSRAHI